MLGLDPRSLTAEHLPTQGRHRKLHRMEERQIVIRGGRLLDIPAGSCDEADIVIEGDTITQVGSPGLPVRDDAVLVDAGGKLLHAGLINAHTHCHGNLAKGLKDKWTLEILQVLGPHLMGHRSIEDHYLSAKIGAAEMVLKGCTACYDLFLEIPTITEDGINAVCRAYGDVGMRAVVAPSVSDMSIYSVIPGLLDALPPGIRSEIEKTPNAFESSLEAVKTVLHSWSFDRTAIRPALSPIIPLHLSAEAMAKCRDLASDYDIGIHTHLCESKIQAIAGYNRHGKSLTAHLDDVGILTDKFTAAHCVWLDDDDFKRLADNGCTVAHNPGSNMRLGSGIADARSMLRAGLNVGVGSDTPMCSDNVNMYEVMRTASLSSKARGPHLDDWLSTRDVAAMATVAGASALGLGNLGRIAPGYKADLVFLDLASVNWIPLNDPVNQLVHCEDGTGVDSVMIGGKFVVEDRKLVKVDLEKLAVEAEEARERLMRLRAEKASMYVALERIAGDFCPNLAREPFHIHRYAAPMPG